MVAEGLAFDPIPAHQPCLSSPFPSRTNGFFRLNKLFAPSKWQYIFLSSGRSMTTTTRKLFFAKVRLNANNPLGEHIDGMFKVKELFFKLIPSDVRFSLEIAVYRFSTDARLIVSRKFRRTRRQLFALRNKIQTYRAFRNVKG